MRVPRKELYVPMTIGLLPSITPCCCLPTPMTLGVLRYVVCLCKGCDGSVGVRVRDV